MPEGLTWMLTAGMAENEALNGPLRVVWSENEPENENDGICRTTMYTLYCVALSNELDRLLSIAK